MTQSPGKPTRLAAELAASADYLRSIGALDAETHAKIRTVGKAERLPASSVLSASEIKGLRRSAQMSQAAFASHLNVTAGYVSQLERGLLSPTGPALALLNVIRRKGMGALL